MKCSHHQFKFLMIKVDREIKDVPQKNQMLKLYKEQIEKTG